MIAGKTAMLAAPALDPFPDQPTEAASVSVVAFPAIHPLCGEGSQQANTVEKLVVEVAIGA
jgi:hypothetical protein